jgi:hypothetical protein
MYLIPNILNSENESEISFKFNITDSAPLARIAVREP